MYCLNTSLPPCHCFHQTPLSIFFHQVPQSNWFPSSTSNSNILIDNPHYLISWIVWPKRSSWIIVLLFIWNQKAISLKFCLQSKWTGPCKTVYHCKFLVIICFGRVQLNPVVFLYTCTLHPSSAYPLYIIIPKHQLKQCTISTQPPNRHQNLQ